MDTSTLLIAHYMTLIKNVAYLAANGVEHADRMNGILARATEHLCVAKAADAAAGKDMLRAAIEEELSHVHIQHPRYAEALRQASHMLAGNCLEESSLQH